MKKLFPLKSLLVFSVIFILLIASGSVGAYLWLYSQIQPTSESAEIVRFVIPRGQAAAEVADRLEETGLIRNALLFRAVASRNNLAQNFQAGSFILRPNMSALEIAQALTQGTNDEWVTVQEGLRAEEIADKFIGFSGFDSQEFIQLAKPDEGFLFPDTYLFPLEVTAAKVHETMLETFDLIDTRNNLRSRSQQADKNFTEVVIIASLLEREASVAEDMAIVAGIIENRLKLGMPLQIDATMQYASGYDQNEETWWSPPTAADKQLQSPYNTYLVNGLPPGPISNPGLKALEAAIDSTPSDFLFYLTDLNGNMHYALTYEEHQENIATYLR